MYLYAARSINPCVLLERIDNGRLTNNQPIKSTINGCMLYNSFKRSDCVIFVITSVSI